MMCIPFEYGRHGYAYISANRVADIMRRRGQGLVSVDSVSSQDDFENVIVLESFPNVSTCFQNGAGQLRIKIYCT